MAKRPSKKKSETSPAPYTRAGGGRAQRDAPAPKGITEISVSGYKSIGQRQSIEIRPLTILAGANSSGKSSIMQPLLLLKQTLEATYDPGALLLDGPNVRFTSAEQVLSRTSSHKHAEAFEIGIGVDSAPLVVSRFVRHKNKGFEVNQITYRILNKEITLRLGLSHQEIMSMLPSFMAGYARVRSQVFKLRYEWTVIRNRCFLEITIEPKDKNKVDFLIKPYLPPLISPGEDLEPHIRELIHLPGLRGNPERTYPVTAVGSAFPGTFEKYAASIIAQWQEDRSAGELEKLGEDLKALGLTWKVTTKPIKDTQVELQVGRLPQASAGGARDMVSIADVGLGVSQTLPVVVALLAAKPGQLVFLEQPEIHLHPRAQMAMAQVLADAANRGVRVVVETHSALLILGVQTLVAEGKLVPDLVKLHWFKRANGTTRVESADLDEAGSFGDWPEDFADISLEAQSKYLDAAEARMTEKRRAS